ncbi:MULTISPECIES: DUF948 domain-containing protein [Micrococcaceae]|uniref:DUF948 domain-containing protein n=1 Tax=Micrococcaceae TaxID=1268 RepID=UPI00071E2706|nr:DUF948 domain-containing protein [Arthrobacter sp. NIO-1057]KSU67976.1 hypothetical protein AS038_02475 [Arthrobacter sp. NIO-1057]SCB84840.1 protein of unknown function [Arthrobacter sp. NIO-1057]
MSGSDIAGLIAAGAFVVLVVLLAVPIIKLGKVFDELRSTIKDVSDGTTPLLGEVANTVATTNDQLKKVDTITTNVSDTTANVSALSSLVAATIGKPLIKVAAFTEGVKAAMNTKPSGKARRSR